MFVNYYNLIKFSRKLFYTNYSVVTQHVIIWTVTQLKYTKFLLHKIQFLHKWKTWPYKLVTCYTNDTNFLITHCNCYTVKIQCINSKSNCYTANKHSSCIKIKLLYTQWNWGFHHVKINYNYSTISNVNSIIDISALI